MKYKIFKFKETDDSPDFALPERINELIAAGVVKVYRSLTDFKNRKNENRNCIERKQVRHCG